MGDNLMNKILNVIVNIIYLSILIIIALINFNSNKYIYSIFIVMGAVCFIYNLKKK